MTQVAFDALLEAIEHLPEDGQADLLDVVRRRLAERGRNRVTEDVRDTRSQFQAGSTRPASVDEIIHEIES